MSAASISVGDTPEHSDGVPIAPPRFLSESDCRAIMNMVSHFTRGGGYTSLKIMSTCVGNIRWARNQVNTSGEVSNNYVEVQRNINGAACEVELNDTTPVALAAATLRAERLVELGAERPNSNMVSRLPLEPGTLPNIFSESTYQLNAEQRSAAAIELTKQARDAGMLSSGYIETAAVGMATLDTLGRVRYFAYTQARYSVTVRDPQGTGSGWAGVDGNDWHKIDAAALTARALDKCLRSRNPVRIEPGRYTTILEPQAVADFVGGLIRRDDLSRSANDGSRIGPPGPFFKSKDPITGLGYTKLGERVVDPRITIRADPIDPEIAFPPFRGLGNATIDAFIAPVYHPVTWIEQGVLKNLAYERQEGIVQMERSFGLPNSGAFHMSDGPTSLDEMIATTRRGLLVTRFDNMFQLDITSQLYRGYTRDGLWLIENGKVSKPAKNLVFTESILFALNNVDQIGPSQRVFNPNVKFRPQSIPRPAVVPPLKINDFSFTALSDAV